MAVGTLLMLLGILPVVYGALAHINVTASGSTFVQKLVVSWEAWFLNNTNGLVNISYIGSGSGGGRADFISGKNNVSFSCSDAPMSMAEFLNATANLGAGNVLQIPWALGAVVPVHSVAAQPKLYLTMEELALTMQGVRRTWNDPPLRMTAMINPPLTGNANITVVRRNDSSGTTFAFTDALNRAVVAARTDGGPVLWNYGANSLPPWQNGTLAGQGTGGVIALLQNYSNSIGYAEYGQALASPGVYIVRVRNSENIFLIGDPDATSAAAAASLQAIPDATGSLTGFSIAWAQGVSSYPIATFSYLMVRKDLTDQGQGGSAIKAFITFALSDAAQASAIAFGLVPLPQQILQTNRAVVASIKISDQTAFMQYSSSTPAVIVIDGTLAPTPVPKSDAATLLSSSMLMCVFVALQLLFTL